MRYLLDTHIWVWSRSKPKLLTKRVLRFGRMDDPVHWLRRMLAENPISDAPLTREIATEAGQIEIGTRDPVDLLIVATARVMDVALITEDETIIGSGAVRVLANG